MLTVLPKRCSYCKVNKPPLCKGRGTVYGGRIVTIPQSPSVPAPFTQGGLFVLLHKTRAISGERKRAIPTSLGVALKLYIFVMPWGI